MFLLNDQVSFISDSGDFVKKEPENVWQSGVDREN